MNAPATILVRFDSLAAMLQRAQAPANAGSRRTGLCETYRKGGSRYGADWDGIGGGLPGLVRSTQRTTDASKVDAMLRELRAACGDPDVVRVRRKRNLGDDGDLVVERLREYRFDSLYERWSRPPGSSGRPTAIRVAFGMTASAHRDADSLLWRGLAAIVAADLIEGAGGRAEIVGYIQGPAGRVWEGSSAGLAASVTIKAHDQPADAASLLLAVQPATFRVGGHCAIDSLSPAGCGMGEGGIGILHGAPPAALFDDGTPLIAIDDVWDRDAAVNAVRAIITRFNNHNQEP